MGLFDKRIAYKPFEYPEYYTEGWLKQAQAFWLHTEISMQSDIKDWNEKLNEKEKHLVGNILLGFAQTECAGVRLLDSESCWMVSETRDPTNGNDVWFSRNYTCSCL